MCELLPTQSATKLAFNSQVQQYQPSFFPSPCPDPDPDPTLFTVPKKSLVDQIHTQPRSHTHDTSFSLSHRPTTARRHLLKRKSAERPGVKKTKGFYDTQVLVWASFQSNTAPKRPNHAHGAGTCMPYYLSSGRNGATLSTLESFQRARRWVGLSYGHSTKRVLLAHHHKKTENLPRVLRPPAPSTPTICFVCLVQS